MPDLTPEDARRAQDALTDVQRSMAGAITVLAGLGDRAPQTLRDVLMNLSLAYSAAGWADPTVPYSLCRNRD